MRVLQAEELAYVKALGCEGGQCNQDPEGVAITRDAGTSHRKEAGAKSLRALQARLELQCLSSEQ